MPSWSRGLAIVIAVIGATGCVGATDRADFDREVQRRGGGVSVEWLSESLEALAGEVGAISADDVVIVSITATPSARSITAVARRGDRPDFVDTVTISDRDVTSTMPLRDADRLPLDEITTLVGDLPLDQIEQLTDLALDEFADEDAFVDQITVTVEDRSPLVTLHITSERSTGTVVFDADGDLVGVTR